MKEKAIALRALLVVALLVGSLGASGCSPDAMATGIGPTSPGTSIGGSGGKSGAGIYPIRRQGPVFHSTDHLGVIGDSIAAAGIFDDYYVKAQAYFVAHGGDHSTYLNAGVPGTNVANDVARVAVDLLNKTPKPTLVFIFDGRNDVNGDGPTFSTNYALLLSTIIAGGIPGSQIVCFGDWMYTEAFPDSDTTFDALNVRILAACSAVGGKYVDVRNKASAWEIVNNPSKLTSGLLTIDGTHPSTPLGKLWFTPITQVAAPYAYP